MPDNRLDARTRIIAKEEIRLGDRLRLPVQHSEPSAWRGLLCGKAGATSLFHFVGHLPHRFQCDRAPSAPRERSLRRVHGGENFRAGALALFPQGKSLLDSVFLAMEASALDRLTDKCFLIGRKLYFHATQGRRRQVGCQQTQTEAKVSRFGAASSTLKP